MHQPAKTKTEYFVLLMKAAFDGTFPSVATKPHVNCLYRKDNMANSPCRCAVGLQIPDDKYDPEMDLLNYSISKLAQKWPDAIVLSNDLTLDALKIARIAHDITHPWNPNDFVRNLFSRPKLWSKEDVKAGCRYLQTLPGVSNKAMKTLIKMLSGQYLFA